MAHNFTLIIEGDVEDHLNDLYEAGCDDATFGSVDGTHYAVFDREAPTLGEAIMSAVKDIDSVAGVHVQRESLDQLERLEA